MPGVDAAFPGHADHVFPGPLGAVDLRTHSGTTAQLLDRIPLGEGHGNEERGFDGGFLVRPLGPDPGRAPPRVVLGMPTS